VHSEIIPLLGEWEKKETEAIRLRERCFDSLHESKPVVSSGNLPVS
jgi:hypothetical protein